MAAMYKMSKNFTFKMYNPLLSVKPLATRVSVHERTKMIIQDCSVSQAGQVTCVGPVFSRTTLPFCRLNTACKKVSLKF